MLLHELLVVLSGYNSSIDLSTFKHPVERQIFEVAQEFGELVASLSSSLITETGPVTAVVESIFGSYLAVVVALETQIPSLTYSIVIAETVDEWRRTLEYCHEQLTAQKYVGVKMAVKLRQDIFSGFPKIAEIASQCLEAVDRYYIKQISPWLLWGNMPSIDLEYPEFGQVSDLVVSIGNFLRNSGSVQADKEFIELTNSSHAALASIEYPLNQPQLKNLLGQIQENINTKILPHVLAQSQVDHLMTILGNIVLCRSPLFCISFAENLGSENALSSAISQYYENTQEISAQAYYIAKKSIALDESTQQAEPWTFGNVLTEASQYVRLDLYLEFPIFIDSMHCDVYGDVFYYLLSVWVVNDQLKGYSPEVQYYKLVLNALWYWFQRSTQEVIGQLEELFSGRAAPLDQILGSHTMILRRFGKQIFMGSHEACTSIKKILRNAQMLAHGGSAAGDPVGALLKCLEARSEFTDLHGQLQVIANP